MRSRASRWIALPLSLVVLLSTALAATAAAAPQPYGANDAGGFRSVLPPGENGLDNLPQLFAFKGLGALPPHFADQQPLYENLVYGSPGLSDAEIANYFKDATFGVPAGELASTVEPRPGVVIQRDAGYGVPHIYGDTRADTMFGAGYAGAADRLFLMDVLRHTGRAELASFLGGANAGADAEPVELRPLHRSRPRKADRPDAAALRPGRPAGGRRPLRLRRRDQRLHRRRRRRLGPEAGRVLAALAADGSRGSRPT